MSSKERKYTVIETKSTRYLTNCDICNKETEVSIIPEDDKPVWCSTCKYQLNIWHQLDILNKLASSKVVSLKTSGWDKTELDSIIVEAADGTKLEIEVSDGELEVTEV